MSHALECALIRAHLPIQPFSHPRLYIYCAPVPRRAPERCTAWLGMGPLQAAPRGKAEEILQQEEGEGGSDAALLAEATKRITALGRKGRPREAVAELANLARAGVQPDTQSATALLDACVRNKKLDMAESVFRELFAELLQPDEITFSVLLRGYGEANPPRWTAISATLASMERDYGVVPRTPTYNALLEVAARTNDEARGYEIIHRMRDLGVYPDEFTIEAVRQRKSLRTMLKKTFDL